MASDEVLGAIQRGERILLNRVVINGDIDLRQVNSLSVPLVITHSTLNGNFIAPFAMFQDHVNFSCTTVNGRVDVFGSTFESAASWAQATISSDFYAPTARFNRGLSLSSATVHGQADFRYTIFGEETIIEQANFLDRANFFRALFKGNALFSRTTFQQEAQFTDIAATSNIEFRVATFNTDAFFSESSVDGSMDFTGATFNRPESVVKLDGVSAGSLILKPQVVRGLLRVPDLNADGVEMDLNLVDSIEDTESGFEDKIEVLRRIEDTARSDDRIGDANDAAFRRQVLEHEDEALAFRAFWYVGAEQVAGYLVKPFRPLRAMVVLATIAAAFRLLASYMDRRKERETARKSKGRTKGVLSSIGAVLGVGNARWWLARTSSATAGAAIVAINPKPPKISIGSIETETPGHVFGAAGRWAEWAGQKALNAIFLLALGNAVPSVKEVIDSLID